jgi:imidazoleglycerol-phosphate dehydratase
MSTRTSRVERETSESKVVVELDLDGTGASEIVTGVGFYDHMLTAFSRHSLVDLRVESMGDTWIDAHHTVEDTAIALGQALRAALGDKRGIRRFGDALVPLDEALVHHIVEAQFKALARALRDAVAIDPRESGVPSTKGAL